MRRRWRNERQSWVGLMREEGQKGTGEKKDGETGKKAGRTDSEGMYGEKKKRKRRGESGGKFKKMKRNE